MKAGYFIINIDALSFIYTSDFRVRFRIELGQLLQHN
jgi:hypothetical protein